MPHTSNNIAASFAEPHRPQFHFSPARNWINDPNGLVYFDGEYHLFYQYNPQGTRWGHMSWGHAISTDLLHWTELGVAIPEDETYMIYSGCVVVDHDNCSGFGNNGGPPLVAIYTGAIAVEGGLQNQQLAYSNDRGRSWIKYQGNPVLDHQLAHFRDPKVIWYLPGRKWIMVVALSDQKKVSFYESLDLKQWNFLSDFGPAGSAVDLWECPDLFELPVTNGTGQRKWVLKIDDFAGMPEGGSGAQVFVGDFDGQRFTPALQEPDGQWLDYGRDFYAAASWANLPATDGRCLWLAWMNNHQYAQNTPTSPWRGVMSLPRRVTLEQAGTDYVVLQTPIKELEQLRGAHARRAATRLVNQVLPLTDVIANGSMMEIIAEFCCEDAREFGLKVGVGGAQETLIGYDANIGALFVDRRRSGIVDFHAGFAGRSNAPLKPTDGVIKLHIFLDTASIEVFANNGRMVMTEQIFPGDGNAVQLYAHGGAVTLQSLQVWRLRSIWC